MNQNMREYLDQGLEEAKAIKKRSANKIMEILKKGNSKKLYAYDYHMEQALSNIFEKYNFIKCIYDEITDTSSSVKFYNIPRFYEEIGKYENVIEDYIISLPKEIQEIFTI